MSKFDVENIKNSVDIASIIGAYVTLDRDNKGLCPFHEENTASFTVEPDKQFYHCFGCGEHGDVIDFIVSHTGVSFVDACKSLGGETLPEGKPIEKRPKRERIDPYKNYHPMPTDQRIKAGEPIDLINPKRDGKIWKDATPAAVHPYYVGKELHGYVLRLESQGKKITPQVRHTDQGWALYPFDSPRPLYGLFTLQSDKSKQVLVVEGEKAVDHIRRTVGDSVAVVSWCGGTSSVSKTDWKPLEGRNIYVIPDHDNAGLKAAKEIIGIIKPKKLGIVLPEPKRPKGWDIADQEWKDSKEFFAWCKKNKTIALPDSFEIREDKPVKLPEIKPEKEKQPEMLELSGKDSIDSQVLQGFYRDKLIFDAFQGEWYEYDKIWHPKPEQFVVHMVYDAMDKSFPEGYSNAKYTGTYKMFRGRMAPHAHRDGNDSDSWDNQKHLLPMDNGVLDLKTRTLIPHAPELRINWMLPHKWSGYKPYPVTAAFLESLAGGDAATVQTLLCYLAAIIRGMSYLQKYLELIGTPGTGKSTFINLACQLVGSANLASTSMDQLQNNKFETANLYRKKLAIITDADKYGGNVEVFKAMTGQDQMRREHKNKQQMQNFIYDGMVLVAANQPVQFKDSSTAIPRRRIPVQIDHHLSDSMRDKDLSAKIHNELPGLIYDLVSMSVDYVENILNDTGRQRVSSAHRSLCETNAMAEWLDERVIADPQVWTKIGEIKRKGFDIIGADEYLYPNYVAWCESSGKKPNAAITFRKSFGEILTSQGIDWESKRAGSGRIVRGIRVRLDEDRREFSLIQNEDVSGR